MAATGNAPFLLSDMLISLSMMLIVEFPGEKYSKIGSFPFSVSD
jgi:hypothetical protein